jgi:hypothetical protein
LCCCDYCSVVDSYNIDAMHLVVDVAILKFLKFLVLIAIKITILF